MWAELISSVIWACAVVYAVWSVREATSEFLATRQSKPDADMHTQIATLQQQMKQTQRTAGLAALAAGLKEDRQ